MIAGRRLLFAICGSLGPFALAVLAAPPSYASGDICQPGWKLEFSTKLECDNIAALTPGNDTRVNLLLLLFDRYGSPRAPAKPIIRPVFDWRDARDSFGLTKAAAASGFAFGEGSRCRSNEAGTAGFETAVKTALGLSPEERTVLLAARADLAPDCVSKKTRADAVQTLVQNAPSVATKDFATYLLGADAFYGGRFDEAAKTFEIVRGSADPWLADTADYMVARTQVNALQSGAFDVYGTFKGSDDVDQQAATRAEASLDRYLEHHPDGRYAGSARGLKRRVEWLAGRTEKLATLYAALLAKPASARDIDDVDLVEEIDSKLLPDLKSEMTKDQILLAVLDLKAMRKTDKKKDQDPLARVDLEAQRDAFASAPPLYEFLKATDAFYIDGAAASVIKSLPDNTRRRDGDYVWFSRQFLRGQALEATGDRNAGGFWKELYPGATRPLDQATVELALALHEEKHGNLKEVFAPGSLVTNPAMRIILLANDAGPALLRAQAKDATAPKRERMIAMFDLLYRELTRGRYADFLADVERVPVDAPVEGSLYISPDSDEGTPPLGWFTQGGGSGEIACPKPPTIASHLAKDPESVRDRLCLAEFVRVNGLKGNGLESTATEGGLGSMPSTDFGAPYTRGPTYSEIIDDRTTPAADRAYALYRAVKCYEPLGNNGCGGDDVPKAARKAWYNALKRDYPTSHWAKDLRYWW